jgi:hypothetical protein
VNVVAIRGLHRLVVSLALCVLAATSACGKHAATSYTVVVPPRDWAANPAVVQLDAPPSALYAVSDVHGGYDRLIVLLVRHGLVGETPASPPAARWTGGDALLVVAGDLVDKGPASVAVVDLFRALQPSAQAAGGRVVVLLGNHEAEFLDDPGNGAATRAGGFAADLRAAGIDPVAVASGADPRGVWLRGLPFAARVGTWFFAHGGDTGGRTIADLEAALEASVASTDYHGPEIVGGASILESRNWDQGSSTIGPTYARAVGAEHIVFGHEPHALGPAGSIQQGSKRTLFRIDCGMSPEVNYGQGALLRVRQEFGLDVVESLEADGTVRRL